MSIFGKPLKRAIRNTLGLHAVLMICLTVCAACCLFLPTGRDHVRIQIHPTGCCFP